MTKVRKNITLKDFLSNDKSHNRYKQISAEIHLSLKRENENNIWVFLLLILNKYSLMFYSVIKLKHRIDY